MISVIGPAPSWQKPQTKEKNGGELKTIKQEALKSKIILKGKVSTHNLSY